MNWNKFSDCDPEESGEYWIYRNKNSNLSRITLVTFYVPIRKRTFRGYSFGFGIIPKQEDWTHWMKIEKPKPPKIKK